MKQLLFVFISIVVSTMEVRASNGPLGAMEDSLIALRKTVTNAKDDSTRIRSNKAFIAYFRQVLAVKGSFDYPFDSVPYLGVIEAPDGRFRFITWNLPLDKGGSFYYAFLQTDGKLCKTTIYFLQDEELNEPVDDNHSLKWTDWHGALYYEIIPFKKSRKHYYALLGWELYSPRQNRKVIDVLYFPGRQPRFGAPVFHYHNKTRRRITFAYGTSVQMSLRYHPDRHQIIFDHLAPMQKEMEGIYEYYGPDMTFDALELKRGRWLFLSDVDIRVKGSKIFNNPK